MSVQQVPNLVQGVSQQSPQQRRDSQCEAQYDCINSASDGAAARPHFDLVKAWASRDLSDAYFQSFFHGTEEYVVGVSNDLPFAINLSDGTDATVTQTAGTTYLATGTPANRESVRMAPVEDTIFVLNREVSPAMAATLSATQHPVAYVMFAVADASRTYKVDLTGPATINASVSFGSASSAGLAAALVTAVNGVNGYEAEASGPVVRITRTDHADFAITTDDAFSDTYMYAVKDTCPSFVKLPTRGWVGDVIKVVGESRTKTDDYYVTWTASGISGVWEETVAPVTPTSLNAAKMPHLLVNTGLNAFEYKEAVWSTRIVGDTDSAKDPSFIGKYGRDIFYHENRLGLLQTSGCVWSKANFPYTFFPDTVQTVLADAPVDTSVIRSANTLGVSDFDFPVGFDEGLYLWSQKAQYRISTGTDNVFKQGSVSAKPSTAFRYASACLPAPVGQSLYSPYEDGVWAHLRAIQFSNGRAQGDINLTAHIAKYIPSGVRQVVSDGEGLMFIRTDGDNGSLYVYNFLVSGTEYAQSAWNQWRIPGGDILWIGISNNQLRVLQQRAEGVVLLNCDITPKRVDADTGAGYLTRLDMRLTEADVSSLTYSAGYTTFVLPYKPITNDVLVITRADKVGGFTRGREFVVTDVTDYTVTVAGDLTGYSFYVGQRIEAKRTESEFFLRTDKGIVPMDRLTVGHFEVTFSDTGYTRLEVATPNKATRKYPFEAHKLDTAVGGTETVVPTTGVIKASVGELAQNATISLVNDTYLPSYWQTAAYDYTGVRLGAKAS